MTVVTVSLTRDEKTVSMTPFFQGLQDCWKEVNELSSSQWLSLDAWNIQNGLLKELCELHWTNMVKYSNQTTTGGYCQSAQLTRGYDISLKESFKILEMAVKLISLKPHTHFYKKTVDVGYYNTRYTIIIILLHPLSMLTCIGQVVRIKSFLYSQLLVF